MTLRRIVGFYDPRHLVARTQLKLQLKLLYSHRCRVEKESLEATVFESQRVAETLEDRRARAEEERRSLALANEALTRE